MLYKAYILVSGHQHDGLMKHGVFPTSQDAVNDLDRRLELKGLQYSDHSYDIIERNQLTKDDLENLIEDNLTDDQALVYKE